MITALFLASLSTASAADCDAKGLEKAVMQAAPADMAPAYIALAKCDPVRARKAAGTHMGRMVADEGAIPALVAAIDVGAANEVRAWLDEETPDVRSRLIAKLGRACEDNPVVGDFFVASYAERGGQFWDERWHRGLSGCRTPGVQKMLTEAVTNGDVARSTRNNTQFFSVLEVYARNLGADAIPLLKSFLLAPTDEEEATLLMPVFADAANVGRTANPEVVDMAISAITEAAPNLPRRALERARDTLTSFGKPEAADGFAAYAWPEAMAGGTYTYAIAVVEDATCKNGKKRGVLHLGTFTEPGAHWPDQLDAELKPRLAEMWQPKLAEACKGEGVVEVNMSNEPLDAAGLEAFKANATAAFEARMKGAQKVWTQNHDVFAW